MARKITRDQEGNLLDVDGYKVIKKLGQGGFGVTFLAEKDGADYVIKEMRPDDARDEYNALINIGKDCDNHLSCPVDLLRGKIKAYLITDYIPGKDLDSYIKYNLSQDFKDSMIKQMLMAVAFIHSRNIFHRDIKPPNIMYVKKDNEFFLIDFGIACYRSKGLAVCNGCSGSYLFMSREYLQRCGKDLTYGVLRRNDLFGLGVTFFEMIEKTYPFKLVNVQRAPDVVGKDYDYSRPSDYHNATLTERKIINGLFSGVAASQLLREYFPE